MSTRHQAIMWKYGSDKGIVVSDNKITTWPSGLGPKPTKAQWNTVEAEFVLFSERERMLAAVDAQAEKTRGKFITPGGGQAMAYNEKAIEATACLANYTATSQPVIGTFPLLESEVGITALDVFAVAQAVDAKRQAWKVIEAQINATRLKTKQAISVAADVATMQTILAGLTWPTIV